MNRRRLLDSLLITFLFIFIIAFPLDMFLGWLGYEAGTSSYDLAYFLGELILHMILLLYYVISMQRNGIKITGFTDYKMLVLFLPLLLVVGTNMYMFIFYPGQLYNGFNIKFLYDSVLTLFTAIIEEIVFRFYVHNTLPIRNRVVKIIASAGIFGLLHGLGFIVTFNPYYLVQIVYTFGLGIILGFIMEYSRSLLSCMTFHFLFNFINDCIYNYAFKNSFSSIDAVNKYELTFYLNAIVVGAIAALYLLFLYLFYLKKKDRFYY